MAQLESLGENVIPLGIKKRKRSETPPEEIGSSDETRYVEREKRAEKRVAYRDCDYVS